MGDVTAVDEVGPGAGSKGCTLLAPAPDGQGKIGQLALRACTIAKKLVLRRPIS